MRQKDAAAVSQPRSPATRRGRGRLALNLVAWNLSLAALGIATVAAIGEVYLRATRPFVELHRTFVNVPDVGRMLKPGSVVRHTNGLDFWTTTRVNRWGFADREPLPTSRTEKGCHIALIGDSFVNALQVPIAAKVHVQLEKLAAKDLPQLDVTTAAFGRGGDGQVAQLPFYDKYASRQKPKLVVLLFSPNDLSDNAVFHEAKMSVERSWDGTLTLRPPNPEWTPRAPPPATTRHSFLAAWLYAKRQSFLGSQTPERGTKCLDCTRLALRQFAAYAKRDRVSLVILAHRVGGADLLLLESVADGLPIISLPDYLAARNVTYRSIRWDHDHHWNPAGHLWAAHALLDYLRTNQAVCSARVG